MEFTFDVTLLATFAVEAESEADARALVKEKLNGAAANFGVWPNGNVILSKVGIEGELDLLED